MPFNTALTRNIDALGAPTKKEKLKANTPLKHFLMPLIQEATARRMQMMQQMEAEQGMRQMPTGNSLQGALMSREEVL